MLRLLFAHALAAVLLVSPAHAQGAAAAAKPEKVQTKPPVAVPEGLPVNIRVELTITEQGGPQDPSKRTVSLLVADRKSGSVRSQGQATTSSGFPETATLNVDAAPVIVKDSQMRLQLGLEYVPRRVANAPAGETPGSLNQRLFLIVESGKPVIVSQASDPMSNRKIAVEVTATILK